MPGFAAFAIGPNVKPEDEMYWHVTGKSPKREKISEPNCMGRIVRWLENDQTPLIQKVGAIVLAALAILAVGYLIGHPLFVFSATAIVTTLWAKTESSNIKSAVQDAERAVRMSARELEEQQTSFTKMQEAVGGAVAWEQIPVLDIGDRMGSTGYLNCIHTDELVHPIMKGKDRYSRPFIALRLQFRDQPNEAQAVILFQRFTEGGLWTYDTFINKRFFNDSFDDRDWAAVRQILINEHPRFALVR